MSNRIEEIEATRGLTRKPTGTSRLRRAARLRGAFLIVALMAVLLLAAHPAWVSTTLSRFSRSPESEPLRFPVETLVRTAESTQTLGSFEQAMRYHGLLCEQYPDDPRVENALVQRIRCANAIEAYAEAEESLQELRRRFPSNEQLGDLLLRQAEWQFEHRYYSAAARSYTDLIAIMTAPRPVEIPDDDGIPSAIVQRRRLLAEARRIDKRNRMERLARFNLALCYENKGESRAAERVYARFVRRFPRDSKASEAYFRMGILNLSSGNLDLALENFRKVYDSYDKQNPDVYFPAIYYAGSSLEKQHEIEAAKAVYARVREIEPFEHTYRLASLSQLSRLLDFEKETELATAVFRDLALHSDDAVRRAVARQRFLSLQEESTIAALPATSDCESASP